MTNNISICSMNTRGLASKIKQCDVFDWLKREKTLYLLLTRQDWSSEIIYSSFSSESRRVTVAFRPSIDYTIQDINKDTSGNVMIIELEIYKFHVILLVLYGPNTDCPHFYDHIKDVLLDKENLH